MPTILSFPVLTYRWEIRCAGLVVAGVDEVPDCAGALDLAREKVLRECGFTKREIETGAVVIFWRLE